jgi:iron-siderophore transport system ATP-binding protein
MSAGLPGEPATPGAGRRGLLPQSSIARDRIIVGDWVIRGRFRPIPIRQWAAADEEAVVVSTMAATGVTELTDTRSIVPGQRP